jgi:hypothetical protein
MRVFKRCIELAAIVVLVSVLGTSGLAQDIESKPTTNQFGPRQVIAETTTIIRHIAGGDLDSDGDVDLVTASSDHAIIWYENQNGFGLFGPGQLVTVTEVQPRFVEMVDIDSDFDVDVVVATNGGGVSWYENVDGLGSFGLPITITGGAGIAAALAFEDIDGDGDLDLVPAIIDKFFWWYENTRSGSYWPRHPITSDFGVSFVDIEDMDGDGDPDLIARVQNPWRIEWYENIDGIGTFGAPQEIRMGPGGIGTVYGADMDGDWDADVLVSLVLDRAISWYEYRERQGRFHERSVLKNAASGPLGARPVDLDGDGDIDVAWWATGDAGWSVNEGRGRFRVAQVLTDEPDLPRPPYGADWLTTVDVDGDGELDIVFVASYSISGSGEEYGFIVWHKNLGL